LQVAVAARSQRNSLSIEFPDIKVTVAPDKNSAVVYLTAKGKVSGQKDIYVQELRLRMIKIKRDWLIDQIETVKTLSFNHRGLQLSQLCSAAMRTMEPQGGDRDWA
jgi:hypothetical protein